MKREEKSGEAPVEKQENLREKLKRGAVALRKRGGHTTPILPFWRLELLLAATDRDSGVDQGNSVVKVNVTPPFPSVSARKLAANYWELHHYNLPLAKMHKGVTVPQPRLRRLRHHPQLLKYQGIDDPDSLPTSPDMQGSTSSLRGHFTTSVIQNHRSVEGNNRAIQTVSSYDSSMEVSHYNPAVNFSSSMDLKGRIGKNSYSLKTSTELLRVLNRIWTLEEQHASNISLVKALKKELDHAHARIRELVRDQQADQREMDELVKQIAEDKLIRKSKEQDRITAAIKSVREELEVERKLRKRSESLHRKLVRELSEVKTSFGYALKELEKERKSRWMLEHLCDEFALGIKNYEQEMHALKQKSDKNRTNRSDHGRLILHISESWLDERMQLKLEPQYSLQEKYSVVDKLSSEIEAFLQVEQNGHKSNDNFVPGDPIFPWNSVESIPLNVAVYTRQGEEQEEHSAGSDEHCFELNKSRFGDSNQQEGEAEESHVNEMVNPNCTVKKAAYHDKIRGRNAASLQVRFDERMARAASYKSENQVSDVKQGKTGEGSPSEIRISTISEICEATEEDTSDRKNKVDGTAGSNSNYMIDSLIRGNLLLESENMQPENESGLVSCGNSAWRIQASPVRQWTTKLPYQHPDIIESSSNLPEELKENTLKAKLLEARARRQLSHPRLKASRISF